MTLQTLSPFQLINSPLEETAPSPPNESAVTSWERLGCMMMYGMYGHGDQEWGMKWYECIKFVLVSYQIRPVFVSIHVNLDRNQVIFSSEADSGASLMWVRLSCFATVGYLNRYIEMLNPGKIQRYAAEGSFPGEECSQPRTPSYQKEVSKSWIQIPNLLNMLSKAPTNSK